jgi:putative ribosome biogenesis GTPase RsgA
LIISAQSGFFFVLVNGQIQLVTFQRPVPKPKLRMLDQFLIIAEKTKVPAVIVVNKVELIGLEAFQEESVFILNWATKLFTYRLRKALASMNYTRH